MTPQLPSNERFVSVAGTLTAMAFALVGGFLALVVAFPVITATDLTPGTAELIQGATGIALVTLGYLVFRFAARRDASPRSEDEETYSDPASTLLWGW
ncbi:hypothetical protein ACFQMA_17605 [Halosimplex aquaticum]|uniref:Uncharacterized protein n=1 Tax=Halosimplex aquaticum TaxID=3026162 RepID=A0ABD5Y8G1_9EURY|nr:hypothetical protein [Halosimplex aquaticum]